MAFIEGTQVLSDKGWKNIEDIGGRDRVLVRNFIGDAQFTQPFAIRKRDYSGVIISAGSEKYQFTVTPEHEVVYTDKSRNLVKTTAEKVPVKRDNKLKHRSRYSTDGYLPGQKLKNNGFEYTIDTLDWYTFCGFVLRRGGMDGGRNRLTFTLSMDDPKKDMGLICPVLDRMGLEWTFVEPNIIVLSRKSNIAMKTAICLGSKSRKDMYVPDKMVYSATLEQARALIETFIKASRQDGEWNGENVQFSSSNTKFIDSLEILGLLCGYTVSKILARPAGYKVPKGVTKRDSYVVYIRKSVKEIAINRKKKREYTGKVYEIDMFDDQLLIKDDKCLPIWMKPR